MAASTSVIRKIVFTDKITQSINNQSVHLDEIDTVVQEELSNAATSSKIAPLEMDLLTDLGHLISFTRHKQFTKPIRALQIFIDQNTSTATSKALIKAIWMTQEKDDKSYELICHLAQENKLEYYTNISTVAPLRLYRSSDYNDEYDEYNEWYFIFELFSLTRVAPPELIPIIADWIIERTPSIMDISALINFLNAMSKTIVVRQEVFKEIMPYFHNKTLIETLLSLFTMLHEKDLLLEHVLTVVIPRLDQMNTIRTFLTIFQSELQQKNAHEKTLEFLPVYCQLTQPSLEHYDDKVSTNTPLHLSIIEHNMPNLITALSFANPRLLIQTSYENTALLLACKLGDKKAAKLILAKMQELRCDVNQKDSHGMTALHWAAFYHFDDLIDKLRVAGANDQLKNTDGRDCSYFYHHHFSLRDFKRNGREIIEGEIKLETPGLTDICFHMDKIALNLKLTTPEELMSLYRNDELAQIRSANRFQLFFLAFRTKLVDWIEKQHGSDDQATFSITRTQLKY
ncbi:Dot/Icm T4SS effector AnkQ/LegA10 [Legionella bononiensis]|uniref:Ankyrin repeat domain-containing protein n=1 Tax=Legionella bononiensis TaxID=2793102 RepID=A0ABS1WB50_9GAMM|nr:Dot/Icm T4SS effector AnkQ/LegA10 [Legionella bononiensis]MBL7480184.1 ankyrin repeat domain-containing protein [Legionella bononiensis]MBL7526585.1 ankyrin repeat domain-containing protein [Legionella bononiensis]MBL7562922.1 ankyrin repeat domain-containing protein [Legionella bononiensis]